MRGRDLMFGVTGCTEKGIQKSMELITTVKHHEGKVILHATFYFVASLCHVFVSHLPSSYVPADSRLSQLSS